MEQMIKELLNNTLNGGEVPECDRSKGIKLSYDDLIIHLNKEGKCIVSFKGVKREINSLKDLVVKVDTYVGNIFGISGYETNEVFKIGNVKLKAIEGICFSCSKCFFEDLQCTELQELGVLPKCTESGRRDRKSVYFKEVK